MQQNKTEKTNTTQSQQFTKQKKKNIFINLLINYHYLNTFCQIIFINFIAFTIDYYTKDIS